MLLPQPSLAVAGWALALGSRMRRWMKSRREARGWPASTEALEAAGVGTWEWDVASGAVRWSRNMETLHGLEPGSFVGTFEGFSALVHPDDRPRLQEALEGALQGHASYHIQYRESGDDGRIHWIEASGRVIRDSTGRPERMVGVCKEVTEQKRSELLARLLAEAGSAIARSKDSHGTLVTVARMLVPDWADWCVIDLVGPDGMIENAVVEHASPEKVDQARALRERYPPRPEDAVGVARVVRTGEPQVFSSVSEGLLRQNVRDEEHLRMLRDLGVRSGIVVPLVAHGQTLGALSLISGKTPFHFTEADLPQIQELATHCALAVDTARLHERTREELAERTRAEERLRSIVDHVVDGIITIDETGTIETFNPAAQRIFGYTPDEVVGRNVRMLMPEPDREGHDDYLGRYLATGEARLIGIGREVTGKRNDGDTFPMELAVSEFSLGERRMFTGIVRDITERKAAEEELRRLNETLEQRVRQRTSELEERAHQLRRATLDLTRTEQRERRKLAELLHDEHQQLLAAARMQAERLANLNAPAREQTASRLTELLDEAIQSSRSLSHELSPRVLYASGLAGALEWLAPRKWERYGLRVTVEVDGAGEPSSEDIRVLLFQAARELLFNVAKHAETDEARVTLSRNERGWVELVVEDRGKGFDASDLSNKPVESRGFGLSGMRERMRAVGGDVEVESDPERGTRVALRVPADAAMDDTAD